MTEFSRIFLKFKASGEQGTANVDGDISFDDHVRRVLQAGTVAAFENFSKHSSMNVQVMNHVFTTFKGKPSLQPLVIRLGVGGVDGDEPSSSSSVPCPRKKPRKKKRDAKEDVAVEFKRQCIAERMAAIAQSASHIASMLAMPNLPSPIKKQWTSELEGLRKQMPALMRSANNTE